MSVEGFNWIENLHSRVLMDVKALGQLFRKLFLNIINLLEVQYSISINWLLILILILRLQIHEIVKIQNSVMNLQAILLQEI